MKFVKDGLHMYAENEPVRKRNEAVLNDLPGELFTLEANGKVPELEPTLPLKKNSLFWSNPYKIEVMITSLMEILKLSNFGHMTTSTI